MVRRVKAPFMKRGPPTGLAEDPLEKLSATVEFEFSSVAGSLPTLRKSAARELAASPGAGKRPKSRTHAKATSELN